MIQTFFVIQAQDRIPNLNFQKGDYLSWDYSTGDCDGPRDGRISRVRPTDDIQRARWFNTVHDANMLMGHESRMYPGYDKFKIVTLYVAIGE